MRKVKVKEQTATVADQTRIMQQLLRQYAGPVTQVEAQHDARALDDLIRRQFIAMTPTQQADARASDPGIPGIQDQVSCYAEAKQPSPGALAVALERLGSEICMLEEAVGSLEKRLDPLLAAAVNPTTESKSATPSSCDSPVTNSINGRSARLVGLTLRLRAIYNRIEIN